MSLIARKPRPLQRDSDSFRDDRLFIVACDDTYAPQQYFGFFRMSRVKVHVVPTEDGSSAAKHVLNRLLAFDYHPDDERWLLLDADHYTAGSHVAGFAATLQEARKKGVPVAISKPSFELWLLLHHLEETSVAAFQDATEVCDALSRSLGAYNKRKLDEAHFPWSTVAEACRRAERLDDAVAGGDIPQANTSRVYKLWRAIQAKAHPAQLPYPLS